MPAAFVLTAIFFFLLSVVAATMGGCPWRPDRRRLSSRLDTMAVARSRSSQVQVPRSVRMAASWRVTGQALCSAVNRFMVRLPCLGWRQKLRQP